MASKPLLLAAGFVFALYVTPSSCVVRAQQVLLPPMFQLGAKLTLQGDSSKVYTVLQQQGAWIRVAMTKSGSTESDDTEMWIYAPSGTVWAKAR
jgi:hypothetical protein